MNHIRAGEQTPCSMHGPEHRTRFDFKQRSRNKSGSFKNNKAFHLILCRLGCPVQKVAYGLRLGIPRYNIMAQEGDGSYSSERTKSIPDYYIALFIPCLRLRRRRRPALSVCVCWFPNKSNHGLVQQLSPYLESPLRTWCLRYKYLSEDGGKL